MASAIEMMKDYFTGYVTMRDTVKTQFVLDKINEYILREGKAVNELNERNSVDERKKSFYCYVKHCEKGKICDRQCNDCKATIPNDF